MPMSICRWKLRKARFAPCSMPALRNASSRDPTGNGRSFMSLDTEVSNAEALRRISSAQAFLVDVRRAGDVIPDLAEKELLHAGPPLQDWHEACGTLRGAGTGPL